MGTLMNHRSTDNSLKTASLLKLNKSAEKTNRCRTPPVFNEFLFSAYADVLLPVYFLDNSNIRPN